MVVGVKPIEGGLTDWATKRRPRGAPDEEVVGGGGTGSDSHGFAFVPPTLLDSTDLEIGIVFRVDDRP